MARIFEVHGERRSRWFFGDTPTQAIDAGVKDRIVRDRAKARVSDVTDQWLDPAGRWSAPARAAVSAGATGLVKVVLGGPRGAGLDVAGAFYPAPAPAALPQGAEGIVAEARRKARDPAAQGESIAIRR